MTIISILGRKFKFNYWILGELNEQLYLIRLDVASSFKISLPYYQRKISSLELNELNHKFETVINVSENFQVVIEKGNKLQNKLTLNSTSNNLEVYFVDRDTTLAEKTFNRYYGNQVKIINNGWT